MNGFGNSRGDMGDVPSEWDVWPQVGDPENGGEPPGPRRRFKPRLVLAVAVALVVAAGALWFTVGKSLTHRAPHSAVEFEPSGMFSTLAPSPGATTSTPSATASEPSDQATSASVSSEPITSSPVSSAPAASAAAPASKPSVQDTGPCAGASTWTAAPKGQYANAYLPTRVVMGALQNRDCDSIYVFSQGDVPAANLDAQVGYRITYVKQALTFEPGQAGSPVTVSGRYTLWLQVNAPATGYEAGAPASEVRFRPGDHMASPDMLSKTFSKIHDLVFLGSDQHTSYYAFGLDSMEPFKIWVHLNSRLQVEWALMIAHR